MERFIRLVALLVCGLILVNIIKYILLKGKQYRRASQDGCKSAVSVPQKPWLFGFDIVFEMVSWYDSGSRNMKMFRQFETYGATFRTTALGTLRIFTIDPENLKAVFAGTPDHWGVAPVRYEAFRPFVASGVLITDGSEWRHARMMAHSIIDRIYKHYSSDLSTFDKGLNALVACIPVDGTTVNLQTLLYQYTMDTSTENIFGESIGALKPGSAGDYGRTFLASFLYCLKMAGERDEVPQWTHFLLNRKFRKSCRTLHQYADRNLDRALELCKDHTEWAANVTDRQEVRDHILNVIAASFDTIAILLTNTFFHLARNTECYAKLRSEVLTLSEKPSDSNIKKLQYLHFVLNESLRLNGPATFNSRVALTDTTIPKGGGHNGSYPIFVPKGGIVIASAFAAQRQAEIYGPDPHSFRPERWETVKPKTWEFLPFSGGPRICPGQKFALLHASYSLFTLVRKFKTIENRDPVMDFVEEYRIATGSRNGAQVALWS